MKRDTAEGAIYPMEKEDIDAFIRIMKEIREDWTPEEVEASYGTCTTLKEALDQRLSKINAFYDYIGDETKPTRK